jgi:hypothetical protein
MRDPARATDEIQSVREATITFFRGLPRFIEEEFRVHAPVLDGVYLEDGNGTLRFHEGAPPTADEMDRLLGTIERRIHRRLARRGVLDDVGDGNAADHWSEEAPVLAGIAAASVHGRRALGERAGARVTRGGTASICTRASSSRHAIAPDSSGCAGTRCARRSRRTGCT